MALYRIELPTLADALASLAAPQEAPRHGSATPRISVRSLAPGALTPRDVAAWQALELRAIEPNAYHAPQFLLPALRNLDGSAGVQVVLIERHALGFTELIGAAAVRPGLASRLLPAPHLRVYQHAYTPQGSILIDAEHVNAALLALDAHSRRAQVVSAGLVMPSIEVNGPLSRAWQRVCAELGQRCHVVGAQERAILRPDQAGDDHLRNTLRKKVNEVERCRRRLSDSGTLQWQVHRERLPADSVESFLRLEHAGWKGETGSALLSSAPRAAFFREMVAGFGALGRLMFTEVRLNDQVIASSCNLLSADVGFAFKVAFDPAHRKFGPGILNEMDLVRHAPQVCGDLRYLDSGSCPDSFINELWPGRRTIGTHVCVRPGLGQLAWGARNALRQVLSRRSATSAPPPDHQPDPTGP